MESGAMEFETREGGPGGPETVEPPKVSVYLVTRNEEAHLDAVLEGVRGADEIVVVDSGSTDATLEIARRHGARIFEREWPGYVKQKAFAMARCTHDWVVNLDGDEVLPPGAFDTILRRIARGDVNGLYLAHDDIFMGASLPGHRHHRYCRVYRKSRASWDTGLLVHEHIDVEPPTAVVPVTLTHFGYDSVEGYMGKLNRYALLKARQREARGRGFSNLRLFTVFPVMFLKFYLVRRMCLAGRRGFIKAWIDAAQYFLTEADLYEMRFRAGRSGEQRERPTREGQASGLE
jgi:glycosyltransferase involved in cell wall biosynthesis